VALAGLVVLANLAQVAGIYFWALIDGIVRSPEDALLADNVPLVTATGVVFLALMTWISWRGIEISERIQNVLLAIQYLALAIFVVAALWQFFAGTAPDPTPFDWSWFNPFAFTEWSGFVEAVLLALFIYWGWDTCLALNEETEDPKRIPGRAALLTTVILLFTYVSVTVAAMMYAGLGDTETGLGNKANADDFFLAVKDGLLGPVGWVLVVAVMISAISSTQTTILPTARGTLAMGAYRALPKRFATVHPVYKTPSFSTLLMGVVAIVYYIGMTLISNNILQDSILSLALAIAFYYAITGYACVGYYRRELFTSGRNFFYKFLLPLLGALMLTYAFVQSAIDMYAEDYGDTSLWGIGGTFLLGIGSLAFGVVLMLICSPSHVRSRSSAARASTARRPSSSPRTPRTSTARSTAASPDGGSRHPLHIHLLTRSPACASSSSAPGASALLRPGSPSVEASSRSSSSPTTTRGVRRRSWTNSATIASPPPKWTHRAPSPWHPSSANTA